MQHAAQYASRDNWQQRSLAEVKRTFTQLPKNWSSFTELIHSETLQIGIDNIANEATPIH
jgi:hypothetical protein